MTTRYDLKLQESTIKKRMRLVTGSLVLVFIPILGYLSAQSFLQANASASVAWDISNFAAGVTSSTEIVGNDISLVCEESLVDSAADNDFIIGIPDKTTLDGSGRVVLDQTVDRFNAVYAYGPSGYFDGIYDSPYIGSESTYHSFIDPASNILFVSTGEEGGGMASSMTMIDTANTTTVDDDSFIFIYNETSDPQIGQSPVYHTTLDTNMDVLYMSTVGGLSAVDTQGTTGDPSDDELIITYDYTTTPAIGYFGDSTTYHSHIDSSTGLLYVSNVAGLTVIDTKNTATSSDDELVVTYSDTSSPSLFSFSAQVFHSFLDTTTDRLYISSEDGLVVLDTNGTATSTDDVVVTRYDSSFDSTIGTVVEHSFLDTTTALLYLSTDSGLSVIDTDTDNLVVTYNTDSEPAIGTPSFGSAVSHSHLDPGTGYLFVSSDHGDLIYVIDTNNTSTPTDDELIPVFGDEDYGGTETTFLSSVRHSFYDPASQLLYVSSAWEGLWVFQFSPGGYHGAGQHRSLPLATSSVPTASLSFVANETADHAVSIQYRTGVGEAAAVEAFDTLDNVVQGVGGGDASIVDGVLTIVNPNNAGTETFSVNLPQSFPAGPASVNARVRLTVPNPVAGEEYWISLGSSVMQGSALIDEWTVISLDDFFPSVFSDIDFIAYTRPEFGTDPLPSDAIVEVDWLSVEVAADWGSWSTSCADAICAIDQADLVGRDWIQYRLNLETSDLSSTPNVESVSFGGDCAASGSYQGVTESFACSSELLTFTADVTTPADTAVAFEYSLDNGSVWNPINSGDDFADGTTADSFTWRAALSTANPSLTPLLSLVTLDYVTDCTSETPSTSSGGSQSTRISVPRTESKTTESVETPAPISVGETPATSSASFASSVRRKAAELEAQGMFAAAGVLRSMYPEVFTAYTEEQFIQVPSGAPDTGRGWFERNR